ncbi:MAG: metallophosphoesterase [Bacteroidia bacterium]|nr:metallophosphoesterase [Bacteroidia bacterium]
MSQNLKMFLIISSIFLAIDLYAWQGVRFLTNGWTEKSRTTLKFVYWGYTAVNFCFFLGWRMGWFHMQRQVLSIILAIAFAVLLAKIFWCFFLIIDDVIRLFRWMVQWISGLNKSEIIDDNVVEKTGISRLKFLNYLGLGAGAAFVGTAIWGIAKGAHNYTVRRRDLGIRNLPAAFEGLKIVQISDIHSGSFWSFDAVKRGVEMIRKEAADLVFFTGDIVNDHSDELKPYKALFGSISAPLGVYSILGNHDYGDYHQWPDQKERAKPKSDKSHMSPMQKENLEILTNSHGEMGWKLLLDEHHIIEKDGASMAIIGVENWSSKANFPRYGNLTKAYSGAENADVKLLLSHDPSHWHSEVTTSYKDIDATFSGHTHGMQFGIDTKFYRWSPVKLVYKEWIDMYHEQHQILYVNRGFGYLGFPGRMGIFPEITVFTLKRA